MPQAVGVHYVLSVELDSVGRRVADIRAKLGQGPSRPLSQRAFSALIQAKTGIYIDRGELSRLERDARGAPLRFIDAISRVDPEQRGREWLAWGEPRDDHQTGREGS